MTEYTQGICEDGAAILKDGVMMTVDEIVEALNKLPRWIPVTERLPDMTIASRFVGNQQIFKSENVLVFEDGKTKIERIELIEGWSKILNKATHWMPLPKAPGGEG